MILKNTKSISAFKEFPLVVSRRDKVEEVVKEDKNIVAFHPLLLPFPLPLLQVNAPKRFRYFSIVIPFRQLKPTILYYPSQCKSQDHQPSSSSPPVIYFLLPEDSVVLPHIRSFLVATTTCSAGPPTYTRVDENIRQIYRHESDLVEHEENHVCRPPLVNDAIFQAAYVSPDFY